MAFVSLKSCVADGDLAQAILDVEQNLGDIKQQLDAGINQIIADLTPLTQGNDILTRETSQAPNPLGDYTAAAGLPALAYSVRSDEERLQLLGIIMINGVLYLAGSDGNVDNFRRLYFALGADMDRFIATVNSGKALVVIQTFLRAQKLPRQTAPWTVGDAQTLFKNPAIEAVYPAGDGETYCVVPQFMAVDQSAQKVAKDNNLSINQISTQVFWFNEVLTNSSIINNLNALGISSDQQASILANQRLISVRPSVLSNTQTQFALQTQKAIDQINLLNPRWFALDQAGRETFRKDIATSATQANGSAYALEGIVRFDPTLIRDPQDIGIFLQRNSLVDLDYLFSTRRTVSSINFAATEAQVTQSIRQTLSIQSGATTLSAIQSNQAIVPLDSQIDNANRSLVQNICGLNSIQAAPFVYLNLQVAYGCLKQSLVNPTTPAPQVTPLTGYQSFDSPGTILSRQGDIFLTLGLDAKIAELEALAAKLSLPIQLVVQAIARLIRTAKTIIGNFFNQVRQKLNQYTQQVESFMSRYMALHGTVSIDAGILRCSFGYALSPSLPILQTLTDFIDQAQRDIQNQLALLSSLISTFLNKLLCYPINLANGFLGGLESNLPNFCQAYKVTLPSEIEASLIQIRDIFILQNDIGSAQSRDIFRLTASLQAAPDKLNLFKDNLVCESKANSNFFDQAKSSLGTGFAIKSPASSLPKIGL